MARLLRSLSHPEGASVPRLTLHVCKGWPASWPGANFVGAAASAEPAKGAAAVEVRAVSCLAAAPRPRLALVVQHAVGIAEPSSAASGRWRKPSIRLAQRPPAQSPLAGACAAWRRWAAAVPGLFGHWRLCPCLAALAIGAHELQTQCCKRWSWACAAWAVRFACTCKWRIVREQPAPRLMAVNIDEGEPGTCKDRHCLERDPHRCLEGMLVAAQVVGAERSTSTCVTNTTTAAPILQQAELAG